MGIAIDSIRFNCLLRALRHYCLICFLLVLAGCDLLGTRTPQPPDQQTTFRTPTSADIVLDNLQKAVNGRDVASYTRCFADSSRGVNAYRFIPAADAQAFASRFASWTVKDETAFFLNLKSQVPAASSMGLFVDSIQTEAAASDSTVFGAAYQLVAHHTDPSRPTEARGRMHLTMRPDPATQLWAITQWIDVTTSTEPSWSVMKARFSP